MTVDVSQVVARQIHSRLGCHHRRLRRERATPEQTAYITGINKAILYSVFRHYCTEQFEGAGAAAVGGCSGPMTPLASEETFRKSFSVSHSLQRI